MEEERAGVCPPGSRADSGVYLPGRGGPVYLLPFSKVDGRVQPLVFDWVQMWNFRINLLPFVYIADYEALWEMKVNLIGNTAMFIPIGIIWPSVFRKLDNHKKVIAAGVGFSLAIEILQLPFYDRVTDVDDLILNSLGFLLGYGIFLLVKKLRKK